MEKFFEDDTLANDWADQIYRHVFSGMFNDQDNWINVGPHPSIQDSADFYYYFDRNFDRVTETLRSHMCFTMVKSLWDDNIDMPQDLIDDCSWYFGKDITEMEE